MRITRTGYPDPTQFDPESEYFDPKAPSDGSRWLAVDVEFVEKFSSCVTLATLKSTSGLEKMGVTQKFQRLSVMPVAVDEWEIVNGLAAAQSGN
jgi:predicted RNA-binding protein with PUA-like domain